MSRILQIVLTALALAGTYGALSTDGNSVGTSGSLKMDKAVIFADGSDPMPMCSPGRCGKKVSN
jgi:hypothetical protein